MILRMMTVGAPHDLLRGAEHAGDVVDRDTELQQHGSAGMPQDVRRHISAKSGQLARRPPRSTFLRPYPLTSVFDDMRRR